MARLFFAVVFLLLIPGSSLARSDITANVTINAGRTNTNPFQIPGNVTGIIRVVFPCDPSWDLTVAIQQSIDKGVTWDCQNTAASPCQGFGRKPVACMVSGQPIATVIAQYDGGPKDTKIVMRLVIDSNVTKTFTASVIFDP